MHRPTGAQSPAAAAASLLTILATAEVDGKKIEHRSAPILISTTIKTRVKVKSTTQDGGRIVNRGTTYPADVIVERLDGYTGPVLLQMAASQQRQRRGIRGGELTVPAGVELVQDPVFMPEWLETSLTARINVIGVTPIGAPVIVTTCAPGGVLLTCTSTSSGVRTSEISFSLLASTVSRSLTAL